MDGSSVSLQPRLSDGYFIMKSPHYGQEKDKHLHNTDNVTCTVRMISAGCNRGIPWYVVHLHTRYWILWDMVPPSYKTLDPEGRGAPPYRGVQGKVRD